MFTSLNYSSCVSKSNESNNSACFITLICKDIRSNCSD